MGKWTSFLAAALIALTPVAGAAQDRSGLARFVGGAITDRTFGGTDLELTLSQGVPWRVFTLDGPPRLVVDFREVDWRGADATAMDQSEAITGLRMGPLQPGWSRLVAELSGPMAVKQAGLTLEETGEASLKIALQGADQDDFSKSVGAGSSNWTAEASLTQTLPEPKGDGPLLIMLDPGHGGIDPGAERGGVRESDLVLLFARELSEVLLRTGQYRVILTRDADVFVSLEGRVAAAHQAEADLFISLHADAIEKGIAHGAAVYTLAEEASDAASAALAERHNRSDLLSGLDLSGSDDRVAKVLLDLARLDTTPRSQALAAYVVGGIETTLGHVHKDPLRSAGFSVLKAADIPSILIELGFLSTQTDLRKLQDPVWRAGMAAGIRDGIDAWAQEDAALKPLRFQ
ncbi:MAG: N-acetylmuramoyl-L-alanine amidase [Pelagimonas sp.]|jgi:N-acetylmuramoyl-L-alanine amidase|nr:N-acetylmuramoyl-L-alanine amidase [Pelagimonas sp.]